MEIQKYKHGGEDLSFVMLLFFGALAPCYNSFCDSLIDKTLIEMCCVDFL